MKNIVTLKKLDAWLKKPGNSKSKLAAHLGYESTMAINQWFARGSIPKRMQPQIIEFITQKEEDNGET